ncbi:hypothetical protein [Hydrogenophaga sp.]|uniref:hypothetical protein n=1 Tax=Hydrogenophaga sp. TaxID=1904254 RepID=UPI003F6CFE87
MPAQNIEAVVAKLSHAGLNLSLAPAGGLAVAPSSHLTADLRDLIRSSKSLLITWLIAANDAAKQAADPLDNPLDWRELAEAYHAHHFNCPTCIAAGRDSRRYEQRCGAGMAQWRAYANVLKLDIESPP